MSVTQVEAIQRFLLAKTHPDLASLYSANMEVQVNVAQGNGNRVEDVFKGKTWHGWSDGLEMWKSFRIPRNANTIPEYDDKPMSYNLEKHVEGIGMTGWDWKNKVSKWVAYDFDAIIGHSDKHENKLTDAQLKEIKDVVSDIPWVTVRLSTSGKGLHLYVFLDDVPTVNHTEHAALARAILGILTALTGFDFHSKVDICGGNMWVWHRKMLGTDGLKLIKKGEVFRDVPANWRDHIKVMSGKKKKAVPDFVSDSEAGAVEELFEELSGKHQRIPLDEDHKKLIKFLSESGRYWSWQQDHHMLITHTYSLKLAYEELGLKGIFQTDATGNDAGDHNCFAFPLRKGAWAVRRYSPGVREASTWDQDGEGWTRCFLNQQPDLRTAALAFGGIEDPDKGGFIFKEAEMAIRAANALGIYPDIAPALIRREAVLKEHKDGRLIMTVEHTATDTADNMQGWYPKRGLWKKVFNGKITPHIEPEVGNYDDLVRHLITSSNEDYGWVMKADSEWRVEPLVHIREYLGSLGLSPKEIKQVIGASVSKAWTIVNRPFQPEYIGDRKWNKKAAQLRFAPSEDIDNLSFPNWWKILQHCGKDLDESLKDNPWAVSNGIQTGADYLKCWIASLLQYPNEPLPYLFFYSEEQNTGKSTFHEALEILISGGVERADRALTNPSGFNAEIENAVLCVVEELDLARNKDAYNRIKDWVTTTRLPIHRKGETPYTVMNSTHWIQCANSLDYCPVFPGDSRITMMRVSPLDPIDLIPKRQLIALLEKEAPDFLAAVLNLEVPLCNDRLGIPVITTSEKTQAEQANRTLLQLFLDERCHYVPGQSMRFSDFYARFKEFVDPSFQHQWSKIRVGRELPKTKYPKGRVTWDGAQYHVGNISFDPPADNQQQESKLVLSGDFLKPCQ